MDETNLLNIKEEIIFFCRKLHEKDFLAAADGNISVKIDDQHILITPSGQHKGFLRVDDFALIDINGNTLHGNPSGEKAMHLTVYRHAAQARAVVHAHPPHAIAWSVAFPHHTELPNDILSELILAVGQVPIVPYARPGTEEMGKQLLPFLPQCRVMILARHGALSWGESLLEAYSGMERVEHTAKILTIAKNLGGVSSLPEAELLALKDLRKQLGERSR